MGVRFPSVATTAFIGPLPASAAETICATTPPLTIPLDFSQVILLWSFTFLAGTGTTGFSMRIRRGTTTGGAQVGGHSWDFTIAAAASSCYGGAYVDTPGAVAGQQYTLTCVQTGATGAGTGEDVSLIAFAL